MAGRLKLVNQAVLFKTLPAEAHGFRHPIGEIQEAIPPIGVENHQQRALAQAVEPWQASAGNPGGVGANRPTTPQQTRSC